MKQRTFSCCKQFIYPKIHFKSSLLLTTGCFNSSNYSSRFFNRKVRKPVLRIKQKQESVSNIMTNVNEFGIHPLNRHKSKNLKQSSKHNSQVNYANIYGIKIHNKKKCIVRKIDHTKSEYGNIIKNKNAAIFNEENPLISDEVDTIVKKDTIVTFKGDSETQEPIEDNISCEINEDINHSIIKAQRIFSLKIDTNNNNNNEEITTPYFKALNGKEHNNFFNINDEYFGKTIFKGRKHIRNKSIKERKSTVSSHKMRLLFVPIFDLYK